MDTRNRTPPDLKTCASFELSEEGLSGSTPHLTATFRDPSSLEVLTKLAKALSENDGYRGTDVHRAKGIDAGFSCELGEQCELSVLLGVSAHRNGSISFDLITEWFPPILGRLVGRPAPLQPDCVQRWAAFLDAMNRHLESTLGARQVVWLTREQARERWNDSDEVEVEETQ